MEAGHVLKRNSDGLGLKAVVWTSLMALISIGLSFCKVVKNIHFFCCCQVLNLFQCGHEI
jgi:hypothetical protein